MAEQHSLGFSPLLVYTLFLSVLCLSTSCYSESQVSYHVANALLAPEASVLFADYVAPSRFRRQADPAQQVNSTSIPALPEATVLPETNDNVSAEDTHNDTSSTSSNTTTMQDGKEVTDPTTKDPLDNAVIVHDPNKYYEIMANTQVFDSYWVELGEATKHETLSRSHRVAAVLPLKFKFPFYGHLVDNVTVATGGFIYMSPFLHQWLTATQYIAPLMANFDLSLSDQSNIYYLSLDTSFHVEWRNVFLQDQSNNPFNFQVILKSSGEIVFVYKDVPLPLGDISREKHPVKVGVSDAYYNDTYLPRLNIKRRTIYQYHKVSVKDAAVKSQSVVVLQPLPTCNILHDCKSCTEHVGVDFNCQWCNAIGRCSDGLDWYRQHWDRYGCQRTKHADSSLCKDNTPSTTRKPVQTSPLVTSDSTIGSQTPLPTYATSAQRTTPDLTSTPATEKTGETTTPSKAQTTETTSATTEKPTETPTQPTPATTEKPTETPTQPTPATTEKPTETPTQSTPATTEKPTETPTQSTPATTEKPTETPTQPTPATTEKPTETPTQSTPATTEKPTETPTQSTPATTEKPTEIPTQSTPATTEKPTQTTPTITQEPTQPRSATTQEPTQSTMMSTTSTTVGADGDEDRLRIAASSFNGFCGSSIKPEECSNLPPPHVNIVDPITHPLSNVHIDKCANGKCGKGSSTPVAVIVIIVLLICGLIAGIGGWVFYAYTHPTSKSGMWLMEHRPSQMKAKIQFWKSSSDSGAAKYKMETEA